jgi:mycothione reductase
MLRTHAEGIWAIGDIRNPRQLKHLANQEARVVSHNLLHPEDPRHIDQRVVPHAIFSHPEIGSVGAREVDLRAQRHPYRVGRCGYDAVAYGWALEDTSGFAKVLVCAETGQLLGGHVLGPQAATLVQQLAQAMQFGIPADRLAREQLWCHPALVEVIENALLDALSGAPIVG